MCVFLPFAYFASIYKGYLWKGAGFYAIYKLMDALYDTGMYLRFFIHAPQYMRRTVKLNEEDSFAAI